MITSMFEEFILNFKKKMVIVHKEVLLLFDNFLSH